MSGKSFLDRNVARARYLPRFIAERPAVRWLVERPQHLGHAIESEEHGNQLLADRLRAGLATAAGKLGALELKALRALHGEISWKHLERQLHINVGLFPPTAATFERFARLYAEALQSLDFVGIWFNYGEARVVRKYAPRAIRMHVGALEPQYHQLPWSAALEGKRVAVVHPFADSIRAQYQQRRRVWPTNPTILPDFELITIRAPLSAALVPSGCATWFDALDDLRREIDVARADAVIVGAGGFSIPLAAHARSSGSFALHLGGPTQVLFGIRGRRWDAMPEAARYVNDAWVRPAASETPARFREIEGGCYW